MTDRASWLSPALGVLVTLITAGLDLWRGDVAPLPAPVLPLPAVAERAPLPGEAWRDPFQVQPAPRRAPPPPDLTGTSNRGLVAPSPRPSPAPVAPPPVPPYPAFSGTLVNDGRRALVLEDGLAGVGQRIGAWRIVVVEFDRVVLETAQWRVTLDPEGKEVAPPERLPGAVTAR